VAGLLVFSGVVPAPIVGDIPFENMIGNAKQIVAGVVQDVVNTDGQSLLTIQAVKTYKGTAATTITATAPRPLATNEIQSLRSKTVIVMLDAKGVPLRPTNLADVSDFVLPVSDELAPIENVDSALCVDWMRGLLNRDAMLIMRGLGIAASYCGRTGRAEPIRRYLGESKKTGDALLNMLVGLAYSDPDALLALEQRLVTDPETMDKMAMNITWAMIFYASPDERGAYTLERLALGAKSRQLQMAAAAALANIHSDETWPHLVALLDSAFLYVRHHAVKGLEDTVYAGERSGELAFGEKPLTHLGQHVKRNARKRPPVPDTIRGLFMQPERNDATLVAFWRDYTKKNQ
jgi:hypothetical protein